MDEEGRECIVACASIAVVWGVKTFDFYLRGPIEFTLVTDHAPLTFLMTNNNLKGQYARWSCILQEYTVVPRSFGDPKGLVFGFRIFFLEYTNPTSIKIQ